MRRKSSGREGGGEGGKRRWKGKRKWGRDDNLLTEPGLKSRFRQTKDSRSGDRKRTGQWRSASQFGRGKGKFQGG